MSKALLLLVGALGFLVAILILLMSGALGPIGLDTGWPKATSPTVASPAALPSPAATPTLPQLLQEVRPSIVRIRTKDGEGTGFVAFEAGQVLTAFHIVGDVSARPIVATPDGTEYTAVVLGADEAADLALLAVPSLRVSPLLLASSASVGDSVVAVGYAAGLPGEASITRGIISARRVVTETGLTYIQTDAPLNPGNSGGPLLSERGEVVGVNVARLRGGLAQYENLGFAISTEEVHRIGDALRAGVVKLLPTPTPKSQPTPTPQPIPTSFVVKEYTERRADGGVWLVQQWSDGRYTSPLFVLVQSVTSPFVWGEVGNVSFLTRPGARCTLTYSSLPTLIAGGDGRVWWTWRITDLRLRSSPTPYIVISAECTYGSYTVSDYVSLRRDANGLYWKVPPR